MRMDTASSLLLGKLQGWVVKDQNVRSSSNAAPLEKGSVGQVLF